MVELDQLKGIYDQATLKEIAVAFAILNSCDFFGCVKYQNEKPLIDSFDETPEDELAKQILSVRQTNRVLLALQALGESMKGLQENAQEP